MQYFVRSGSLYGFPELVRELGQNPSAMLREVGLSTGMLHDPDLYFPYQDLARLLTNAAEQCDQADFGLLLASRQGLEITGALGSAVSMQADMASALSMLQQNLGFHARGVRIEMDVLDEFVDIRLQFDFSVDGQWDQLQALSLALMCRSISQLQNEQLPPIEVDINIDPAIMTPRFRDVIGCEVQAGASDNRARYALNMLSCPLRISEQLRQQINRNWRFDTRRKQPLSLQQQVERTITALLPTGECKLERVSKVVDMHPRILQRKLKETNSSFAQLLGKVRLRLACHYLKNSDIDITTLALNLGFADVASFSRVFKKWTKHSPREWRKRAQSVS